MNSKLRSQRFSEIVAKLVKINFFLDFLSEYNNLLYTIKDNK